MTIYSTGIPRTLCAHGAKQGRCIHEKCSFYCGFDENNPCRYFGKASISSEAFLLSKSPAKYAAMRLRAIEMQLLTV